MLDCLLFQWNYYSLLGTSLGCYIFAPLGSWILDCLCLKIRVFAHALGGVISVATFITIDEQLQ